MMFRPDARQIDAARRAHSDWWLALVWTKESLQVGGMLRMIVVQEGMPPDQPWTKDQRRRPADC